jgi:hypothetical protein
MGLALPLLVTLNAVSNLIISGYSVIGCKVQFPDALGLSRSWPQFLQTFMGEARNHAVESGCYVGH